MSNGSENIPETEFTSDSDIDIIRRDILEMRADVANLTSIADKCLTLIEEGKAELMPTINKLMENPMIRMMMGGKD